MRRIAVGLAAAVIAAGVGVAGRAEAGSSYLLLSQTYGVSSSNVMTVGDINWIVDSCSVLSGSGACSNIALVLNGSNVQLEATTASPGVFTSLSTLSIADFSATFEEYTTSLNKTIGSSFYAAQGGSGPDAASLIIGPSTTGAYVNGSASNSTVGNTASGFPGSLSFTPVNDLIYVSDNHITSGLVTISGGTPVPEPSAIAVLGLGLMGLAATRRRGRLTTSRA